MRKSLLVVLILLAAGLTYAGAGQETNYDDNILFNTVPDRPYQGNPFTLIVHDLGLPEDEEVGIYLNDEQIDTISGGGYHQYTPMVETDTETLRVEAKVDGSVVDSVEYETQETPEGTFDESEIPSPGSVAGGLQSELFNEYPDGNLEFRDLPAYFDDVGDDTAFFDFQYDIRNRGSQSVNVKVEVGDEVVKSRTKGIPPHQSRSFKFRFALSQLPEGEPLNATVYDLTAEDTYNIPGWNPLWSDFSPDLSGSSDGATGGDDSSPEDTDDSSDDDSDDSGDSGDGISRDHQTSTPSEDVDYEGNILFNTVPDQPYRNNPFTLIVHDLGLPEDEEVGIYVNGELVGTASGGGYAQYEPLAGDVSTVRVEARIGGTAVDSVEYDTQQAPEGTFDSNDIPPPGSVAGGLQSKLFHEHPNGNLEFRDLPAYFDDVGDDTEFFDFQYEIRNRGGESVDVKVEVGNDVVKSRTKTLAPSQTKTFRFRFALSQLPQGEPLNATVYDLTAGDTYDIPGWNPIWSDFEPDTNGSAPGEPGDEPGEENTVEIMTERPYEIENPIQVSATATESIAENGYRVEAVGPEEHSTEYQTPEATFTFTPETSGDYTVQVVPLSGLEDIPGSDMMEDLPGVGDIIQNEPVASTTVTVERHTERWKEYCASNHGVENVTQKVECLREDIIPNYFRGSTGPEPEIAESVCRNLLGYSYSEEEARCEK
jgi:hypothetical protein